MVRSALLFTITILGMSFTIMPDWDGVTIIEPDPFYFYDFGYSSDGRRLGICWQTYVYMICELLIMIILGKMIYDDTTQYRKVALLFFILQIGNLLDFLLCYNSIWFTYGIPFSYNVFTCVALGIAILYFRNDE